MSTTTATTTTKTYIYKHASGVDIPAYVHFSPPDPNSAYANNAKPRPMGELFSFLPLLPPFPNSNPTAPPKSKPPPLTSPSSPPLPPGRLHHGQRLTPPARPSHPPPLPSPLLHRHHPRIPPLSPGQSARGPRRRRRGRVEMVSRDAAGVACG